MARRMRDGKRRAGLHHDILRGDTARPEDRHLAFSDGDHIAEVRMHEIADADMLRISDVNRAPCTRGISPVMSTARGISSYGMGRMLTTMFP